ncbi:MAG: AraC family transcriptional regulator [Pseudomonadota bacterium]
MQNSHKEHTTLISVASLLADAIEHYGLDYRPIVREAGIDPDKYYGPNERLPVNRLQKIWRLAVERTGDPCFGLTYASYIQPASLHGMGLAWLASDTLKDGLKRLVRYQRVVSTALDIQLEEENDRYHLIFRSTAYTAQPVPASIEAMLASFFRMCRITAGPDIRPMDVMFSHDNPGCAKRLEQFFDSQVGFSAKDNRIVFDKSVLESPLSSAHPELARVNDMMCHRLPQTFRQERYCNSGKGANY